MNTTIRALILITCLAALVSIGACTKKPPKAVSEAPPASIPDPPPPPPPAVAPPPAPEPDQAEVDPYASGDLLAVADLARREGRLGDVYFDFDRSDLAAEARERLAANARFFLEKSDLLIQVQGHCDERGTNEYNLALGERRAAAVVSYLEALGVAPGRLTALSLGEERQVCTEIGEACWRQNRRAHFVLLGRKGSP